VSGSHPAHPTAWRPWRRTGRGHDQPPRVVDEPGKRTVLFFRDYRQFHGGHLKVRDYFDHVLTSTAFTPRIVFSPESVWDQTNPWRDAREYVVDSRTTVHPALVFVAGQDWRLLDRHPAATADIPIVNFLQHIRHTEQSSARYDFLRRRAVRICVSDEVADAVRAAGISQGPIVVIPNGIDLEHLPANAAARPVDVLIAAVKQPERGTHLAKRLEAAGRRLDLVSTLLPRRAFIERIRQARVTLFLPNKTEGFYLPALEGMALGTLVVCPDCVGNRSFCLPGYNAFRPAYENDAMLQAVEQALTLPRDDARQMRDRARQMAKAHSLDREREAFLTLLNGIDQLWAP